MVEFFRSTGVPLRLALPKEPQPGSPVIVAVHGISRNSDEHLERLAGIAPPWAAVVAPHFSAEDFPGYQKLGFGAGERRADLWLDAALEALSAETGLDCRRFHLFGFSGGAQFAHRYALLNPHRVHSLQLAAAGYYTYLDPAVKWPRGLREAPLGEHFIWNRNFFLRLPIEVYVGERDTARDPALRQGRAIDRQQGLTRRDRAAGWTEHLRRQQAGLTARPAGLTLLPGVDHEFLDACDKGDLPRRLLQGMGLMPDDAAGRDGAFAAIGTRPAWRQGR